MPYFVFRTQAFAMPQVLAETPTFADASARAKALRAELTGGERIRVVFAENVQAAEDLLLRPRDRVPGGDDE